MIPTPRTDAEASDGWSGDVLCVSEDFARTLERELTEARAQRDQLAEAAKALVDRWETPLWKDVSHTAKSIHVLAEALAAVKATPTAIKPQPTYTFNGHPVTLVSNNGPLTGMVEIQRADGSTEFAYHSELIPIL